MIIQIHMVLEPVLSVVCVVCVVWVVGREVCVVVVVVDVVFPVVCGDDDPAPELAFWAIAGTTVTAHTTESASRQALKPLRSRKDFIGIPFPGNSTAAR